MLSLHFHNIICICNSGSAIKDHPTITPTNITTKLSAPLQSSSNINKSNLLALIDEILLSELLFDIERQVESKNINISIVHWPSSLSTTMDLSFVTRHNAQRLRHVSTTVYIPRPIYVYSLQITWFFYYYPTYERFTFLFNKRRFNVGSYFNRYLHIGIFTKQ